MKSGSNLEKVFEAGEFAVTAELGPPKGNDVNAVIEKAKYLRGVADAVNVTDNQTAIVRMSSIATSKIILDLGLEPVMQMTCRDRNRIGIESDIFGASALGIKNCLCLSGDHQRFGNEIDSKNVYDLDSIQLLNVMKNIRDEGRLLGGEEVEGDVNMFIGAAANPFGDPFEMRVVRLAKKVKAGADFIQTQCIYDMDRFREWMKMARDRGLHERTHIMGGVMPLKSGGMARYMQKNVPGITIPDDMVKRMLAAPKGKGAAEGIKICIETIEQLKEIEGVDGVHVMALEWEHRVPEICEEAGLLPRPSW